MLENKVILLVEDDDRLARLYRGQLEGFGVTVHRVSDGESAKPALADINPDLIMLDIQLPGIDGFEVLRRLQSEGGSAPVIAITAHGSINWAVEAMRLGAYDFLVKPFTAERLAVTLQNAIERAELATIVKTVTEPIKGGYSDFVGDSAPMQAVYRTIAAASVSKASIFITGESGTGKELCAQAVHRESPRRSGPFLALNCGAIPRELMESEIFGHKKGSFTGASQDRQGAAELADGGTLFLDEIGEMDPDLQTKLLRFVQTGSYTRIGEMKERSSDIRYVCATNRDPAEAIRTGALREDLFYRLNVIPIRMPALRARTEDIAQLASAMLGRIAEEEGKTFDQFEPDAISRLEAYEWPGNVRELENVIRNVVVLNSGPTISASMIDMALVGVQRLSTDGMSGGFAAPPTSGAAIQGAAAPIRPLSQVVEETIQAAIDAHDGSIPKAAAALQVAPSTIYRKLGK